MKKQEPISETKRLVTVFMKNESESRVLKLSDEECTRLVTLKKKILNMFDFEQSQGSKIKLSIMQVYPTQPEYLMFPIFNHDNNLKTIMRTIFRFNTPIRIFAEPIDESVLERKEKLSQEAIDEGQLHFDQNGSIIEENDEMINNIPIDPKFDNSTGHIRCQFCQQNNQNAQFLKRCGGLYGPFTNNKYVHLLCALWCHKVYLNREGHLLGVDAEMSRAAKLKCVCCTQKGAGLMCVGSRLTKKGNKSKCSKKYHFKCAYDAGCEMKWITYKMLCPSCKVEAENLELLEPDQPLQEKIEDEREESPQIKIQVMKSPEY